MTQTVPDAAKRIGRNPVDASDSVAVTAALTDGFEVLGGRRLQALPTSSQVAA